MVRLVLAALGTAGLIGLYFEFYAGRGLAGFFEYASYFTNLSNAGYVIVLLGLALLPRAKTDAPGFVAFRGAITVAMVATGAGYAVLLSDTASYFDNPWVNYVIHAIMPIVALVDWLAFPPGPPRIVFGDAVWRWLIYPAAFAVYTAVRGALISWYPYFFIDPGEVGVRGALLATATMGVGFTALAAGLVRYQHWRIRTSGSTPSP
jgi:hypothetical protein